MVVGTVMYLARFSASRRGGIGGGGSGGGGGGGIEGGVERGTPFLLLLFLQG